MSLEEYEILRILGESIDCSSYKVQNKITKTLFAWYAVDCCHLSTEEKYYLYKKINERKSVSHPHFLRFHNYIEHADSKILYISTDFHKNGSLKDVIKRCIKNGKRVCEEFIVKIIYQISSTFKTSRNMIYSLKLEDIFLDDDYNVKLLNFDYTNSNIPKSDVKMLEFIKLITQLCRVKIKYDDICDFTKLTMYSKDFRIFLNNLSEDFYNSTVSESVNKILCHPTILLKLSQWTADKCFIKNQSSENISTEKENHCDLENTESSTQKFRKWEQSLRMKESHLKEMEYLLTNREKKINALEKLVKEKLTQAELYLKRCRDTKSTSSNSTKSSHKSKKISYEDLDTTYPMNDEDSVIAPASRKVTLEKSPKPSSFIRTFSERKVRFKGHSPLKEIDFNRRRTKSTLKAHPLFENKSKISPTKNSGKSSFSTVNTRKISYNNNRTASVENRVPDNSDMRNLECRPISWTEESKKQAFELLRIMNAAGTKNFTGDVKHTYL